MYNIYGYDEIITRWVGDNWSTELFILWPRESFRIVGIKQVGARRLVGSGKLRHYLWGIDVGWLAYRRVWVKPLYNIMLSYLNRYCSDNNRELIGKERKYGVDCKRLYLYIPAFTINNKTCGNIYVWYVSYLRNKKSIKSHFKLMDGGKVRITYNQICIVAGESNRIRKLNTLNTLRFFPSL